MKIVELFYVYLCGVPRVYPLLEGNPVAPLGSTDSLCERRDLVARHPGHNPDHKRSGLKPWLSAVGMNDTWC